MASQHAPGAGPRRRRRASAAAAAIAGASLLGAGIVAPAALAASQAGAPYTDVSGSSDLTAIELLTAEGVLNGYPDNTFKPGNTITRAEFAAAVVRLLGPKAQQAANALANTTPNFKDATSIPTWAWGYVNYAQGQGLVNGYPDGTFQATNNVTMVEAAAILVRAIGDQPAVPPGSWPSNYTLAAYNLNIANGVTFVANLPASRGDVAQMTYDAALLAPTLQSGYASGTPTGQPLYMGGAGFAQSAWAGQVSSVTTSSIALQNAQGSQILSASLAPTYYLAGATDITQLQGLQVTVAANAQGQVDFIQVQQGVSTKSGTLAGSSVSTPAGYTRLGDFLVQNGSAYALLQADGSLVPLVSTTSGAGTNFYLNTPTTGVSSDGHALVPGATSLRDGDSISVTVNGSGQAVSVFATDDTAQLGVVQAINTTNNTLTYSTGTNDGTQATVTVQPWTSITLNGSASSLSSLQKNDVVTVQIVGDGNGGDTNARLIAATRQTVSGTINSVTTQSNGSSTTTQVGLTEQNGQTATITEDSSFDAAGANMGLGNVVQLVLDANGQARLAIPAPAQQVVVLIKGLQTQTTQGSNGVVTTNQVVVDNAGQTVTYTLSGSAPQPGSSGYLAVLSIQPGTNTATVSPLNAVSVPSGYTLRVLSDDGNTLVLQEYNSAGQATGNGLVVTKGSGAVVYNGMTYESFGSLTAGQTVSSLWASASSGTYLGIRE